jgi:hypothetical protein
MVAGPASRSRTLSPTSIRSCSAPKKVSAISCCPRGRRPRKTFMRLMSRPNRPSALVKGVMSLGNSDRPDARVPLRKYVFTRTASAT